MIKNLTTEALEPQKKTMKIKFVDPFGYVLFVKRFLVGIIGIFTYHFVNIFNKTKVEGAEHLMNLPDKNVLFVSNHQTYFMDVIGLYHIFGASKWGFKNINNPIYNLFPRINNYYIAAEETMKEGGLLPKIFCYAGAVLVKRAWRHKGKDVQRSADFRAPAKIKKALEFGWVINFPQGTTGDNAPVRKGSANLIRALKPIVVPVKIDGFSKGFHKKGLKFRKKGTQLNVKFGEPIQFPEGTSVEEIHEFLKVHIEIMD